MPSSWCAKPHLPQHKHHSAGLLGAWCLGCRDEYSQGASPRPNISSNLPISSPIWAFREIDLTPNHGFNLVVWRLIGFPMNNGPFWMTQWGDQSPKFRTALKDIQSIYGKTMWTWIPPPKKTTWMIEPCWAMLSLSSATHWIQGFPTEAGGFNKFCWIHRRKALAGLAGRATLRNFNMAMEEIHFEWRDTSGKYQGTWMMDFPYQIARRLRSDLKTRPERGWGWTAMEDSINNGTLIGTDINGIFSKQNRDISATAVGYTLHLLTYTYIILNANNQ